MTTDMIRIDGSEGEGGGQVLRTSLSLAMVTGKAFTIENIRAGRAKPGLMRQHLTCVKAAADICGGEAEGAELKSSSLTFTPGDVKPGTYDFAIGTAGATTLVAQTVLPALMMADAPSNVTFEGGTHNMQCPSYEFIEQVFLPHVHAMGVDVHTRLHRRGYYPAGGGQWVMEIGPAGNLKPIEIMDRGDFKNVSAEAVVSQLPPSVGKRELKVIEGHLDLTENQMSLEQDTNAIGPGNVVQIRMQYDHVTELVIGHGKLGVSAESIGKNTVRAAKRFMKGKAAVGPHLADQLLLPMALAGGGRFTCLRPSLHTMTNVETIKAFLPVEIDISEGEQGVWTVQVGS